MYVFKTNLVQTLYNRDYSMVMVNQIAIHKTQGIDRMERFLQILPREILFVCLLFYAEREDGGSQEILNDSNTSDSGFMASQPVKVPCHCSQHQRAYGGGRPYHGFAVLKMLVHDLALIFQ